jgi:hypothetical protein
MPYTITLNELIERPVIRDDKFLEYLNKMTDGEIKQFENEIEEVLIKDDETKRVFPDWNVAILAKLIDREILYEVFKLHERMDDNNKIVKTDDHENNNGRIEKKP